MEKKVSNQELCERFEFRMIRPEEAEQAAMIEEICFPPNEACPRAVMLDRVKRAPETFLVAADRETGKLAGLLNGIATNEAAFRDAFFTDAGLHDPNGKNIMFLGLDVLPEYRGQGVARELMRRYLCRAQEQGKSSAVLTCKEEKIAMYQRMGYRNEGISASVWGDVVWYEMRCPLISDAK